MVARNIRPRLFDPLHDIDAYHMFGRNIMTLLC